MQILILDREYPSLPAYLQEIEEEILRQEREDQAVTILFSGLEEREY